MEVWRDGRRGEKRIPHAVEDDTDGGGGQVGTKGRERCLARRTWGMVAPDWRGSKGNYREWSKLGVELLLAGLNCSVMEG